MELKKNNLPKHHFRNYRLRKRRSIGIPDHTHRDGRLLTERDKYNILRSTIKKDIDVLDRHAEILPEEKIDEDLRLYAQNKARKSSTSPAEYGQTISKFRETYKKAIAKDPYIRIIVREGEINLNDFTLSKITQQDLDPWAIPEYETFLREKISDIFDLSVKRDIYSPTVTRNHNRYLIVTITQLAKLAHEHKINVNTAIESLHEIEKIPDIHDRIFALRSIYSFYKQLIPAIEKHLDTTKKQSNFDVVSKTIKLLITATRNEYKPRLTASAISSYRHSIVDYILGSEKGTKADYKLPESSITKSLDIKPQELFEITEKNILQILKAEIKSDIVQKISAYQKYLVEAKNIIERLDKYNIKEKIQTFTDFIDDEHFNPNTFSQSIASRENLLKTITKTPIFFKGFKTLDARDKILVKNKNRDILQNNLKLIELVDKLTKENKLDHKEIYDKINSIYSALESIKPSTEKLNPLKEHAGIVEKTTSILSQAKNIEELNEIIEIINEASNKSEYYSLLNAIESLLKRPEDKMRVLNRLKLLSKRIDGKKDLLIQIKGIIETSTIEHAAILIPIAEKNPNSLNLCKELIKNRSGPEIKDIVQKIDTIDKITEKFSQKNIQSEPNLTLLIDRLEIQKLQTPKLKANLDYYIKALMFVQSYKNVDIRPVISEYMTTVSAMIATNAKTIDYAKLIKSLLKKHNIKP